MIPKVSGAGVLAQNTLINLAGHVLPLLCGLIAIPAVIQGIGIERFGILSLSWVVVGYFGLFDLGLGRATTRFVSTSLGRGTPEDVPKIVWTSVALQGAASVAGAVVCALLVPILVGPVFKIPAALQEEARATFYVLAASLPVVVLGTTFRGVLEAAARFDLVNWVRIPSASLLFIAPAVQAQMGHDLPRIMVVLVAIRAITLLIYAYFSVRLFPSVTRGVIVDRQSFELLTRFGLWVTISALIVPLLNYAERFMIVTFVSVGALAYYSAPYEALSRLTVFPTSLGTTLFPAFGHYQATNAARLDELFLRPCKYLAILMAPMVAVLCAFSHELLNLWLGHEFSIQARVVFPVLAVTFFLNGLAAIPYVTVQGLGRADIKTRLDLAEVVVFLALTAWLVRWGIDGVAFAKLTITILDGVALLWASHRLIGFTSSGIQASRAIETILVCAGYAAAIIVVRLIPFDLVTRSLAVAAATIAFMALSWRFPLDDRDKGLIRGLTNPWRFRPTV